MKYAVVAHDAGGAELLSSYVRQHSLYSHFVLEGPAIAIFERKLGPLQLVDLQWAIANSDELICSTSWQSDLEVNAISQAKSAHKKSVAILDHWLNYKERFERNGITTRPNQILVCDETANKLAIDFFPDIEITQVDNPYLLDVAVEFRQYYNDNPILAKRGCRVLYLGENISDHAMARYGDSMYFGYSEETALSYFIKNIDKLNLGITEIAVRPHPSEKGMPSGCSW